MADLTPPPSIESRIQQWLVQDGASNEDVSHETSPEAEQEPEAAALAEESDDYEPQPNAQVEGDEAPEGIRSFADLAKHLDVPEEDLAKHLTVLGRDGKEVPLAEVLGAYRAPAPDKEQAERSQARLAELEAKEAEIGSAAEELRQTAQALAKHLRSRERTPEEWATLQRDNPNGFMAAQLEQLRQEQQLERAAQQYQQARQREFEAQQAKVGEFRREQARKLQAAVPEWTDTKRMQADLEGVSKWLVGQGISEPEVQQLTDHRDWLIARKAMLYDQLQAKKPALLEKVRALPKLIAPGASGGADRGRAVAASKADVDMTQRLSSTGKVEDAAALIAHRLSGSARRAAGRTLASGRRSS